MDRYTIGIDFGTLSERAVLVRVRDGAVAAQAEWAYPHGVMDSSLPSGQPLPRDWALQHPGDYLQALEQTVPRLLTESGVEKEAVIAVGVDFTGSTTLPVTSDGTPLCFLPEFAQEPHAYVKLWKHHAAQTQADRMTRTALERGEDWLAAYGGGVSCEWSMPKLWQMLEEAPRVCEAMDIWIEAGDWIVWQLCGTPVQSACSAGFKSFYRQREGYPQADYFAALDPDLERLVSRTCRVPVAPVCSKAGGLSDEMAGKLGLCPGTAVSVSMVDAHAGMLAVGITGPGQMGAILGTSACFMTLDDRLCPVPGISGVVEGGILPGCWGYEAGQSCVGDGFAWFADNCVPEHYAVKAREQGLSVQQHLTALARTLVPGESGLLALDWLNGCRSVLADSELTGTVLGLTLKTRPEEIYRALIEAAAFGARMIVEIYRANGVRVEEFRATGGIARKNDMMMQIYADVLELPVHVVDTDQGGALGSAIIAAAAVGKAGGGYDTAQETIRAMAAPCAAVYYPNPAHVPVYRRLFQLYARLHDDFGRDGNSVMKQLRQIARDVRG